MGHLIAAACSRATRSPFGLAAHIRLAAHITPRHAGVYAGLGERPGCTCLTRKTKTLDASLDDATACSVKMGATRYASMSSLSSPPASYCCAIEGKMWRTDGTAKGWWDAAYQKQDGARQSARSSASTYIRMRVHGQMYLFRFVSHCTERYILLQGV